MLLFVDCGANCPESCGYNKCFFGKTAIGRTQQEEMLFGKCSGVVDRSISTPLACCNVQIGSQSFIVDMYKDQLCQVEANDPLSNT